MTGEPVASSPQSRFSYEQKIGIGLLLIFAITSVALGFLQIRNRLYKPFALNNSIPGIVRNEIDTVESLRYRDTDFDGLNDFDEQYVHGTSVYLEDTDSDGVTDLDEVRKGTNPICAAGKNCELEPSVTEVNTVLEEPEPTESLDSSIEDATTLLSDPTYVRQLMVTNGMKKEEVDKLTDKQIMAMVQSALTANSSTLR